MTHETKAKEPPSTATSRPRGARTGRKSDTASTNNKVSVTFTFTAAFTKQLRMAVGASPLNASQYVEHHLRAQVVSDLKKATEGLR